jgi:hypothetical protein
LTGAGGVGKTRLALRLARDLENYFSDGVWLIDLAPLSEPDLVAQTIATAIGVRVDPHRSVSETLLDELRDRQLLLVLDTCEHLVAACAVLVEALLREAPELRIIATSREALGVSGETAYRVPSLSLPDLVTEISLDTLGHSDATLLFVERARAAEPAAEGRLEHVGGSLAPSIRGIKDRSINLTATSSFADHSRITGSAAPVFPDQASLSFLGSRIGRNPCQNMTILMALKRMDYKGTMTGYGFRGLASTVLHEQGYTHDYIKLQLAHVQRNAVSAAYNHALYLEARTTIVQGWADSLECTLRGGRLSSFLER